MSVNVTFSPSLLAPRLVSNEASSVRHFKPKSALRFDAPAFGLRRVAVLLAIYVGLALVANALRAVVHAI